MSERSDGGPIEIRLMNEYSVEMPLWDDEGLMADDELDLSDALRADLMSFARRWADSIPSDVFDDRWEGDTIMSSIMSSIMSARYALPRLLNPFARRRAVAEDLKMRRLGAELRDRLQLELGSGYRVTYRH